jgi:hypothetical protein
MLNEIRSRFLIPLTECIQQLYYFVNDPDLVYSIMQIAFPKFLKIEYDL